VKSDPWGLVIRELAVLMVGSVGIEPTVRKRNGFTVRCPTMEHTTAKCGDLGENRTHVTGFATRRMAILLLDQNGCPIR
jgi:hypothetical protein